VITLVAVAALYGVTAGVAFRLFTNRVRVRQAANLLIAHILEFRLFIDEPSVIWRAQRGALRANCGMLQAIALPTILMAVVFAFAWEPMERRFGHGPLKVGEATVMTAHTDPVPCFAGLLFETPGVYIPRTGETVWRVRLVRALKSPLPAGVELRYPKSNVWLVWFLLVSSVSSLIVLKMEMRQRGPRTLRLHQFIHL
jgi:hypothetical protein